MIFHFSIHFHFLFSGSSDNISDTVIVLVFTTCYYRPQRSCGQGNIFTGVCLSTGGEGVCLSACWDAIPPRIEEPPLDGDPPGWRNPPDGDPPGWRPPRTEEPPSPPESRLQHTVYERPVRILLECILVNFFKHLHTGDFLYVFYLNC